jgi:hypothetical protein
VEGLADASAVSFESVSTPGSYMRQENLAIRVAQDDGAPGFAADATFHREPGLADETWASFRSASQSGHYLRHADYLLRLDPIGADAPAADREDATFQVVY